VSSTVDGLGSKFSNVGFSRFIGFQMILEPIQLALLAFLLRVSKGSTLKLH
jgi:hypothetical protein